jgi:hypothetical protein
MKFEQIGIENEESMNIAATILNRRAYRVTKKAHSNTLEAIRQEMADGWEYVVGTLEGVPCVVGSYDSGGVAVDIACRPDYVEQHAIEMMLEHIEDQLSEAERIVIVADPQIESEKRLVGILRRYGYSRSDSVGHPHENGQFMARSMAVLA